MKGSLAFALALAVSGSAFALVTETFTSNTDGYWDNLNTRLAPQNYGWSNTDFTGNSVLPPVGGATGAGELGGILRRSSSPANYYGFNIGSYSHNEMMEAHGVVHLARPDGGSGIWLGWFSGAGSYGSGGDAQNFIGVVFDDSRDTWVQIFDKNGSRDRSDVPTNLVQGVTMPFSLVWSPPPAGSSEKGKLDVTLNGVTHTHNYGGDLNFNAFTTFGIMPVSANGGAGEMYFDDLSFSSKNPIPEPASLSLLALGTLALRRRRA